MGLPEVCHSLVLAKQQSVYPADSGSRRTLRQASWGSSSCWGRCMVAAVDFEKVKSYRFELSCGPPARHLDSQRRGHTRSPQTPKRPCLGSKWIPLGVEMIERAEPLYQQGNPVTVRRAESQETRQWTFSSQPATPRAQPCLNKGRLERPPEARFLNGTEDDGSQRQVLCPRWDDYDGRESHGFAKYCRTETRTRPRTKNQQLS